VREILPERADCVIALRCSRHRDEYKQRNSRYGASCPRPDARTARSGAWGLTPEPCSACSGARGLAPGT
jgi:hypothetical protein